MTVNLSTAKGHFFKHFKSLADRYFVKYKITCSDVAAMSNCYKSCSTFSKSVLRFSNK